MANQSAKKIVKQNKEMLFRAILLLAGFMAVYVGVRFIWWYESTTRGHWFGLLVVLVSNAFGYYALKFSAKPTIAENGDIEDGGADLTQRGLVEYWWDLLYITWFIQISTLISDWFWLIYAIIPLFATYQIWVNIISPYLSTSKAPEETAKDRKRREKMEKKATKPKFVKY